jgi:cysteine-rich secretory family protein
VGARVLVVIAVVAGLAFALGARGSGDGGGGPPSPCGPVTRQPRDLGLERTREVTLCLLNAERAQRGLAPLRADNRLELAASRHSDDMVARQFFEHDAPDGVDPQQRMLAGGYRSDNAFTGENIAWGTGDKATPAAIVDLWMRSAPHREDVLRPEFVDVGIGVALGAPERPRSTDPPATYTTDFGGPPVR